VTEPRCARWVGRSIPPKALEPIRRQRGVSRCILNNTMSQVGLQRARVVAIIRRLVAAGVPQRARMRLNAKTGRRAQAQRGPPSEHAAVARHVQSDAAGAGGDRSRRWLATRRAAVGWPSVDSNDPVVHRRRHRRPAQARVDDLRRRHRSRIPKETNETLEKAGGSPIYGNGFDRPLSANNDMEGKITHANANLHYAVQLVHAICCLASSASYLDDIRADLRALVLAKDDGPHRSWWELFQSKRLAMCSSCAGAITSTCHRSRGNGSPWP
jgi:hypothetical protein